MSSLGWYLSSATRCEYCGVARPAGGTFYSCTRCGVATCDACSVNITMHYCSRCATPPGAQHAGCYGPGWIACRCARCAHGGSAPPAASGPESGKNGGGTPL